MKIRKTDRARAYACAAIVSLSVALPGAAAAFNGKGGTQVAPVNNAVFEVVLRGNSRNAGAYWCGASDYARRALKAPWSAKVYVARSWGPSVTTGRKSAIQFTLDPAAAGIQPRSPSLSLNKMPVGDNMSIQQANMQCNLSPVTR